MTSESIDVAQTISYRIVDDVETGCRTQTTTTVAELVYFGFCRHLASYEN